jgi:tetratricopeptide (TPR) repeat protein
MKTPALVAAAAAALALAAPRPACALADPVRLGLAHSATLKLDVDEARMILATMSEDEAPVALEKALLAIYEGECDAAVAMLHRHGLDTIPQTAGLAEIARGCARITAGTSWLKDEEHGVHLRFKNDEDLALAPYLTEVALAALDALDRDLGVRLPRPLRIEVVSDHYSLAAMTGLPEESAQTTGTVAVAKWGRVTMLSPRAAPHGYPWADTLMHELTHLSETRASRDRAPLWLQEGVAKREETRWRPALPFDNLPAPEAVARLGFDRGLALPLDKMGPSLAMLPTAEQAMVAFAEVHSFVRYWSHENGEGSLGRLLEGLATAPADDAVNATLRSVSGSDLAAWSVRWEKQLPAVATLPPDLMPYFPPRKGEKAPPGPSKDLFRSARLAELLTERGHPAAALGYARKTQAAAPQDPAARARLALLLRSLGQNEEASKLVDSLDAVHAAHGLFLAAHGVTERERGEEEAGARALRTALELSPLDPAIACELLAAPALPADPRRAAICQAARRR